MKLRVVPLVACCLLSCTPARVATAPTPDAQDAWACVPPDPGEEGRLACAIVEQLFEQARLAKAEPARVVLQATAEGFAATVERGASSTTVALPLKTHVYAPLTWAPLVHPLFGEPEPAQGVVTSPVLEALTKDSSARTIAEQAGLVAAELQAAPRQVFPHVKAGLLLAVLAWREGGLLADPREFLTLATAQLAIAAGLWPRPAWNDSPGPFDALVAWTLIDALVSADESFQRRRVQSSEWRTALGVTIDGNWKQRRGNAKPMGIERLVRFQVLAARAGSQAMDAELDAWGSPADPVFSRAVFGSELLRPVPTMRRHAEDLFEREAAERAEVSPLLARGAAVIPEAAWRRHFSRNACNAAIVADDLFRITLGQPEQADQALAHAKQVLADDPLWPRARFLIAARALGQADCRNPMADRGELPFRLRARDSELCGRTPPGLDVPRGTVYDADFRFSIMPRQMPSPSRRDDWLALVPSAFGPRLLELQATSRPQLTADRASEVMGPLMSYDRRAANTVGRLSPRPTKALLEAACEAESSRCGDLVLFLRSNNQPEYLDVLERWRRDPASRVAFSNFARPLLDKYFEEKRLEEAEALANEVAATGSGRGLEIRGVYLERIGRYADAEEVFRSESERYADSFVLDDFYVRAGARGYLGGRYTAQARDAERRLFGGPLAKVTKAQLAAPDPGVPMTAFTDPYLVAFGLRPGDVALAVDGVRVTTTRQFMAMLHRTETPNLQVIVVRDGAVVELKGKFRRQRYGK